MTIENFGHSCCGKDDSQWSGTLLVHLQRTKQSAAFIEAHSNSDFNILIL